MASPEAVDSLVGRTLAGTYRIDAALGSGGMGAVYAATHARTGRRYAVKILLPEVAARTDAVARFRREAEAVGALGSAHVVAIHDFAESDGLAYLVMDLLEGEDLSARMDRGPVELAEAIALFEQIASGLAAAHARGIVHRDLKPANVFLTRTRDALGAREIVRPVLLDFGLAKSLAPEGDLARLTASGVVMGTPQYMAPEQASGDAVDARADLYALATMLYEMLAGQPPFSAPTLPALFAKLVSDPPPALSSHRPDLPRALSDVLSRALAKAPRDRYPDAASLVRAVRVAVGSEAVPRTHATPAPRPAARGLPWGWLAASIALAIASAAGAGVAIVLWRGSRTPEPPHARSTIEIAEDQVRAAVEEERQSPQVVAAPYPPEAAVVPDEPAVAPEPVGPVAPSEPRPRPRVARSDPHAQTPARASPAPAAGPPPAPAAPPPGSGPPAGVQEAVAHMQRSDWRGCIRAARAAPRSPEVLGARMNCALQAHDGAELRATCAEMRAHYPAHPQTRACDSLLRAYGGTP